MKNKKIVILLIVIDIIIIAEIYNFISKNTNIKKEKQIIKEMSSSAQETELNNQINTLNTEHTEYMNYIQTCKTSIATALTNEGVPTSNEATLEKMAEKISNVLQARTKDATATADNITEGKTAYVNGELITGTGVDNKSYYEQGKNEGTISFNGENISNIIYLGTGTTFDVTSYEGYENFTSNNFIIEAKNINLSCTSWSVSKSNLGDASSSNTSTITKVYTQSTGKLTLSGISTSLAVRTGGYQTASASASSTYGVYLLY